MNSKYALAAACLLPALSWPAFGALVTVTGGITGYSGPVGGCGLYEATFVNGQNVTPSTCSLPDSTSPLSMSFPSTASVPFYFRFSGTNFTQNSVGFTPAPAQDVQLGSEFLLGTLSYENGNWFTTAPTLLRLVLTTASSDPSLNGQILDDFVAMTITFNGSTDPRLNADFVSLSGFPVAGSCRVYELGDSSSGNIGSCDLYGRIGSLIPTRFANAQGGAFVDPGTGAIPASAVPEPLTLLTLTAGLMLTLLLNRKGN